MPTTPPRLSKSRVQSGAQCHLRLWYDSFQRDLAPPVDPSLQFVFDRGTQIGLVAQDRYPGGRTIDAKHNETELALEQTTQALVDPSITALFEPAFIHNEVMARIDVLERAEGGAASSGFDPMMEAVHARGREIEARQARKG